MGGVLRPLSPREELISELEGLGYDTMPGVAKDWADWRVSVSDDQLRTIIERVNASFATPAPTAVHLDETGETEPAFPDIGELVEAIDEIVAAGDAWREANPTIPSPAASPEWQRFEQAFQRLRDLQSDIEQARTAL